MIKVKTLKPISDGKGKLASKMIPAGVEIDFENDIANWRDQDIYAAAEELERLGYVKILKPQKAKVEPDVQAEPEVEKVKAAPKKQVKLSKKIDEIKK